MSEVIAVVESDPSLTITTLETPTLTTSTNLANPAVVESVDFIADVDVTTNGKNEGAILVYRTTTNKWTSTTTLDAQNMEGGEF